MAYLIKNGEFMIKHKGFTLIELLVVLAIMALLSTLVLPRYFQHLDKGKEIVLQENLRLTRQVLTKFYHDQGRYPDSLQELLDHQYLNQLPYDPIAETRDWLLLAPAEGTAGKIYDLRSTAQGQAKDGRAYREF